MRLLTRIFGDHRIDEWASEYTLIAARMLNQVCADLIIDAEKEIANARWKDGLIAQTAFVNERIAPMVREVAEPAALMILEEANCALRELVEHQAVWVRGPEHVEGPSGAVEGLGDIAVAAVPLAASAATAAALPVAAVTTSSAMLGLATVTTVSWPVVIGGGAVIGLGVAAGVLNSAKIWDKTEARLRARIRSYIRTSLISGTPETPSILQQLATEFAGAAEKAKNV